MSKNFTYNYDTCINRCCHGNSLLYGLIIVASVFLENKKYTNNYSINLYIWKSNFRIMGKIS